MSSELRGRHCSGLVSRMLFRTARPGEETRSVKVLVVGATGGLGRDVVSESLSRGHQTAALARDPSRATLLGGGSQNLVGAMAEAGVRRLACVTLMGLGSSRANCSLCYREVILRVRPPRFVSGRPRGTLKVIAEGEPGRLGRVVRADLARFLVDCASEDRRVREALAVGS
jgi:NAD(P)-dependent dehydrogenase (short-subunit alcohol dehydrogenase family)